MSAAKHTPGRWIAYETLPGRWIVTRILTRTPPTHEFLKAKDGMPAQFRSRAAADAAIAKATGVTA